MNYKYGLLDSSTLNLGNEIQSVIVRQFLPKVDCYLDGDYLHNVTSNQTIKLIVHGSFNTRPKHWPPSPAIKPLFISFNIAEFACKEFTSERSIEYFKQHEPIGCRDRLTQDLLQQKGVETYFSGCITFTLKRDEAIQRTDEILLVDLDREAIPYVPPYLSSKATIVHHTSGIPIDDIANRLYKHSHLLHKVIKSTRIHIMLGSLQLELVRRRSEATRAQRFGAAERLLTEYAQAKFVITSRLHCALPCVALGTPVIFVHRNPKGFRFPGLLDYVRTYSIEEFKHRAKEIDLENPGPNPKPINGLRENLIRTCKEFIGSEEIK